LKMIIFTDVLNHLTLLFYMLPTVKLQSLSLRSCPVSSGRTPLRPCRACAARTRTRSDAPPESFSALRLVSSRPVPFSFVPLRTAHDKRASTAQSERGSGSDKRLLERAPHRCAPSGSNGSQFLRSCPVSCGSTPFRPCRAGAARTRTRSEAAPESF